jgi:TPR repeat protein
MMNVWTGNLCGGVTDAMPTSTEARAWLEELAELSREEDDAPFVDARRRLAEVLVFGAPGVAPDYAAARAYIVGEAPRDPQMLLYLAYMAEHGLGGDADQARALDYLRQAEALGNASASALLAQAREFGSGVVRDEAAAFARYEQLARHAVAPPVWFRLGLMYLEGRGVSRDPCRARQWLDAAAGHAWTPVPQARPYLETIRAEGLCTTR